jgi:hypothetical protein
VNNSIVIEALWRNAVSGTGVQLVEGQKIAMQSIELAESENGYKCVGDCRALIVTTAGPLGRARRLVAVD